MLKQSTRIISCLLLLFALSACGFKLRGQASLPRIMAVTAIETVDQPSAVPSSAFIIELSRALQNSGVIIVSDKQQASARLQILKQDYRSRALAIGQTGAVREHSLEFRVDFSLLKADATALLEQQQIRVTRDILYNETEVLGRVVNEDLARAELIKQAASALLRRIEALANKQP